MKTIEINIRDPYVLLHNDVYYLYGTRSETCWSQAEGFDCYKSNDLKEWEGPFEIFRRPDDFFADREFWAPECIYRNGYFYLITTFGSACMKKGIYILRSEEATGPFSLYSERLVPEEWECLDGSLYFEEEQPYLIFSHAFQDVLEGDMCIVPLSNDLKCAAGEPEVIFSAKDTKWAIPFPYAKEEFGIEGDAYFTDGPCAVKIDGTIYMTWSSWSQGGYAIGTAWSRSGDIHGPWEKSDEAIFPENGGHGMVFRDKEGILKFALHYPNDKYKEHPVFTELCVRDGQLVIKEVS